MKSKVPTVFGSGSALKLAKVVSEEPLDFFGMGEERGLIGKRGRRKLEMEGEVGMFGFDQSAS